MATDLAVYPDAGSNLYYPALGLAGESGEVCERVKKLIRNKDGVMDEFFKNGIKLELGDVLWYIANMAREIGVTLEDVAQSNINKLVDRRNRGVLKGEGENR